MEREHGPRRCPQQQIRLAFDPVDVREEARHQSGSDQQRQRDKTLMHQERIRFSARTADDIPQVTKAQESLVLCCVLTIPLLAREDSRAATHEGRACTQNKVLVIMDYGNFRKQAYRRTGSQRDSIAEVTDSIQRNIGRFLFLAHKPANWT
jgi:hypothetical protein